MKGTGLLEVREGKNRSSKENVWSAITLPKGIAYRMQGIFVRPTACPSVRGPEPEGLGKRELSQKV